MSENPLYARIAASLFVKNPACIDSLKGLADAIDINIVHRRTVPPPILYHMKVRADGLSGNRFIEEARDNPLVLADRFSLRDWAYMQALSQYLVIEGVSKFLQLQNAIHPAQWNQNTVNEFYELSMTLTYYSALLVYAEANDKLQPVEGDYLGTDLNDEEVQAYIKKAIAVAAELLTAFSGDAACWRNGWSGLIASLWCSMADYTNAAKHSGTEPEPLYEEAGINCDRLRVETASDLLTAAMVVWGTIEGVKSHDEADKVSGPAN